MLSVMPRLFPAGRRGLEVHGNGSRSPFPLDLHRRLRSWHRAHYSPGALALRHDASHRHSIFQGREEEDDDGP